MTSDLHLSEDARTLIDVLKAPIYTLGFRGPTRRGKSFLASALARYFGAKTDPFTSKSTLDSVTIGVNFFAIAHPLGGTILILDSEGDHAISKEYDPKPGLALTLALQQIIAVDTALSTELTGSLGALLFNTKQISDGTIYLDTLHIGLNRYDGERDHDWLEKKLQSGNFLSDQRNELFSVFKQAENRNLHFISDAVRSPEDFNNDIKRLAESILKNVRPFGNGFTGSMFVEYMESALKNIRESQDVDTKQIITITYEKYARKICSSIIDSIDQNFPGSMGIETFQKREQNILEKYEEYEDNIGKRLMQIQVVQRVSKECKQSIRSISEKLVLWGQQILSSSVEKKTEEISRQNHQECKRKARRLYRKKCHTYTEVTYASYHRTKNVKKNGEVSYTSWVRDRTWTSRI